MKSERASGLILEVVVYGSYNSVTIAINQSNPTKSHHILLTFLGQ